MYCILNYFGILFIMDITSVLRGFILWDQRLLKDCFVKNSEALLNYNSYVLKIVLIFC